MVGGRRRRRQKQNDSPPLFSRMAFRYFRSLLCLRLSRRSGGPQEGYTDPEPAGPAGCLAPTGRGSAWWRPCGHRNTFFSRCGGGYTTARSFITFATLRLFKTHSVANQANTRLTHDGVTLHAATATTRQAAHHPPQATRWAHGRHEQAGDRREPSQRGRRRGRVVRLASPVASGRARHSLSTDEDCGLAAAAAWHAGLAPTVCAGQEPAPGAASGPGRAGAEAERAPSVRSWLEAEPPPGASDAVARDRVAHGLQRDGD